MADPYKIKNVNEEHKNKLSPSQRFAVWITGKIGTMPFFYVIFIWTFIWLSWNVFAPKSVQFDPAPDFLLWLLISNMIQIFLMPLLLIGQNLQGQHAEVVANNDFEVNLKAELEIRELQKKVDQLLKERSEYTELLQQILKNTSSNKASIQ